MNFLARLGSLLLPQARLFILFAVPGLLVGCDRGEVQVYRVAKEKEAAAPDRSGGGRAGVAASQGAGLRYKVPEGWEEVPPGEMRVASLRAKGADGKTGDVSVIPLPGMAGGDLGNVNRWRGQVGLGPLQEAELANAGESVTIAGQPAKLYDVSGENPGSGDKARILAAILRKDGVAWFFKMTGDADLVASQKQAFVGFLSSIDFSAEPGAELPPGHPPLQSSTPLPADHPPLEGMMGAAAGASAAAERGVTLTPPDAWKEAPAGQFLVAKYTVGAGAESAAINVSMSAGDGGGVPGNVNRWRRQLGLEAEAESEIAKSLQPLGGSEGNARLVDMTGTDPKTGHKTRLVAAIVPRTGQTWFYKLMGDETTVSSQKDAFTRFVQTATYTNAR